MKENKKAVGVYLENIFFILKHFCKVATGKSRGLILLFLQNKK